MYVAMISRQSATEGKMRYVRCCNNIGWKELSEHINVVRERIGHDMCVVQ